MKHIYGNAKNIFMKGINIILPPRCPISGEIVSHESMVSPRIWSKLDFISSPFCHICGVPIDIFIDNKNNKNSCLSCLNNPPNFKSLRSIFIYNDTSRDLILGFKHGDKTHYISFITPLMYKIGIDAIKNADYIIPVPLHKTRLIARRYNQSALMASALSKVSGVKFLPLALKRVKATPPQGGLAPAERKKNVQKAFKVDNKYNNLLKNKSVILIDDVYTTGATINECCKTLLKCGINEINVLTIARVTL